MSTIPTVATLPIVDFTPSKIYPSFSSIINQLFNITTLGAGAQTLTAAQIIGGFIIGTPTAAATYTTDTALNIVRAIQGAQVGSGIFFTLRNNAGAADTITLAAGTGVTLNSGDGTTVAEHDQRTYLLIVTALPDFEGNGAAATIYNFSGVVAFNA